MKKLIVFGENGNVDWAAKHVNSLVGDGVLEEAEYSKDSRSFGEALVHLGRYGQPQIIVFAATPTGLWSSKQLNDLCEIARNCNPLAVVAFAPPPGSGIQEEDRRCKLWRIVDRDQTDRSAHDSLFEIFCSVFGDD